MATGIGMTDWSRELVKPADPQLNKIRDRRAIEAAAERQRQQELAAAEQRRRVHQRTLPGRLDEARRLGATPLELAALEEEPDGMPQAPPQAPPTTAAAPAPRAPEPPARLAIEDAADEFEEREREYMADPDAWERKRMAAPPVSGEIRYDPDGAGPLPERSYNAGANRTDVKGDPAFARFRDDKVFGQDIAPRKGGGSVSMMQGLDDPLKDENYRNYLRSAGALDDALAERAEEEMYATLAKNPFAQEDRAIEKQIALEDARARGEYGRALSRQRGEQDARAGLLAQVAELEDYADAQKARAKTMAQSPEELRQMEEYIDRRLEMEKMRIGVPTDAQWDRLG